MNTEILVRNRKDMVILDEEEINYEDLMTIFLCDIHQTVYVTRNEKLYGIITLGDFRRNQFYKKELINSKFVYFLFQDEDKAINFLCEKESIHAVPVLNKEGDIVKEFYREVPFEKTCFEQVLVVCRSIVQNIFINYDLFFCVVSCMTNEEKQKARAFCKSYCNRVYFVEKGPAKILKEEQSVFVCDFSRYFPLSEILYKKWNVDYMSYNLALLCREEIKNNIRGIAKLYKQIAVVDNDLLGDMSSEIRDDVFVLNSEELNWNKEESCYEYVGKVPKEVECVFMAVYFYGRMLLFQNRRYVPVFMLPHAIGDINISTVFHDQNDKLYQESNRKKKNDIEKISSEFDMIYNIIPKLQRRGIECVVIEHIGSKENLHELLPQGPMPNRLFAPGKDLTQEFMRFLDPDYGEKIAKERGRLKWIAPRGIYQFADITGKYVNYKGGERFTVGNPDEYSNTVFLFGPCFVWGSFVEDSCTIASVLRKKIIAKYYIKNAGTAWFAQSWCMRKQFYKTGDIAIIFSSLDKNKTYYKENGLRTYSVIEAYKRVENLREHIWDRLTHCDKMVIKEIAEEVFSIMLEKNVFSGISQRDNVYFGVMEEKTEIPKELEEWLESVSKYKVQSEYVGAIVMNCNPFTKGHRYLIEEASKQVDVLYIFVVEEDKSFFSFQDRLRMVIKGTSDISNVVVIPSGKYIISTVTLPGYFNKEDATNAEFDFAEDLELFGAYIAKNFEIKVRFAGEEPNDIFTNHYNQEMARILPQYGIRFCEVPRKKFDGQVISATTVRKYIKQRKWENVQNLVLPQIYEYLYRKRYEYEKHVSEK
ncbi:[citrate (Pro-3S)-lyase] ligase [Lachnospiraceae bacterium MD308]|nr:[citrate (Pro-3S)-lyase] ligase [Lachnospiraceae bacterium MD308]